MRTRFHLGRVQGSSGESRQWGGSIGSAHRKTASLRGSTQSHPHDAALGIKPRHDQRFHVKHVHVRRQGSHLAGRVPALHGQPDAARGQGLPRSGDKISQGGKGAG